MQPTPPRTYVGNDYFKIEPDPISARPFTDTFRFKLTRLGERVAADDLSASATFHVTQMPAIALASSSSPRPTVGSGRDRAERARTRGTHGEIGAAAATAR